MIKKVERDNKELDANSFDKTLKCGLVMPISAIDGYSENHWAEVKSIITEALSGSKFLVDLVSNANEIGVIQGRIVKNIYHSDIVVCDVSAKNPNVMFELGMRLAFDKPTVIIKDDVTNYSFDTAPIEHITYPRSLNYVQIVKFKETLRKKVEATFEASKVEGYSTFLKHFGEFVVSGIPQKEVSSEQFMLDSIRELKEAISYLSRSSLISAATPFSEIMMWLDHRINDYIVLYGGNREIMFENKSEIVNSLSIDVVRRLGLSFKESLKVVENLFDELVGK
uniref:hypothetical protein n=1 Tax=Rheinheimera sp. TaxID=1869214 RepID=UPI0037C7AEAE